ncbi:UNVERIFIED_CONTAM: hypothetical protein K2H54_048793 [Gekko kuhli]
MGPVTDAMEIEEFTSVYEEVDEEQYSKMVKERQDDDWIVDDDGIGYVEDGREIFDEDLEDDALDSNKKRRGERTSTNDKKNVKKTMVSNPNTIKSMFMASTGKKNTDKAVDLSKDDLLGDILQDLNAESVHIAPPPIIMPKKKRLSGTSLNPFSVESQVSKRTSVAKTVAPVKKEVSSLNSFQSSCSNYTSRPQTVKEAVGDPENGIQIVENGELVKIKHEEVTKENEQAIMDFDDEDFNESMEDVGTVAEKVTSLKEELKLEDEKIRQVDSMKAGLSSSISNTFCWDKITENDDEQLVSEIQVDSSELPLLTGEDGQQVFRFYWLDAYEDQYNQPGMVFLFGKVWIESAKSYVSCCVAAKNIERTIYLLPRESRIDLSSGNETKSSVTMMDVYQEFNDKIAEKYKIMKFKSRVCF